jgi:hypothetical protein
VGGEKRQMHKIIQQGGKISKWENTPFLKESRALVSLFTNDLKLGNRRGFWSHPGE